MDTGGAPENAEMDVDGGDELDADVWQDTWLPECHVALHNWDELAYLVKQEAVEKVPEAAKLLGMAELADEWVERDEEEVEEAALLHALLQLALARPIQPPLHRFSTHRSTATHSATASSTRADVADNIGWNMRAQVI